MDVCLDRPFDPSGGCGDLRIRQADDVAEDDGIALRDREPAE